MSQPISVVMQPPGEASRMGCRMMQPAFLMFHPVMRSALLVVRMCFPVMQAAWTRSAMCLLPCGMSRQETRMGRSGGRMTLGGGGLSCPGGRVARPGLAAGRGTSPGAECLGADEASADPVLESAVEGAAAGPAAERGVDVGAREGGGEVRLCSSCSCVMLVMASQGCDATHEGKSSWCLGPPPS